MTVAAPETSAVMQTATYVLRTAHVPGPELTVSLGNRAIVWLTSPPLPPLVSSQLPRMPPHGGQPLRCLDDLDDLGISRPEAQVAAFQTEQTNLASRFCPTPLCYRKEAPPSGVDMPTAE